MGAVLAGLVVGCSSPDPVIESPAPVVSEEPSPTPNPTPTPTPTGPVKPERPADMDRTDEVGAAAAATYFLELYPYVMATGDLTEWDAISYVDLCEFCVKVASDVEEYRSAGSFYTGGEVSVEVTKTYPMDTLLGAYPVDVRLAQAESAVTDANGRAVDRTEATAGPLRVELIHNGAAWLLLEVSTNMPTS
ncbi:DUF6318 family protein [Oerskovia jenensis]|uniref:DUF6318 domain-containing protein n=1 Tax=Oerskovia jenensis TaxID=162169 RepID=A0ABS2LC52_9CELL|nr:DUF6318 family protein [Oerskovia jenensis]MBM7477887.1 hypothetical protein [Oerskovia jenensis]